MEEGAEVGGALLLAGGAFAVLAGANDGSTVLSAGLRVPGLRLLASLAILLGAVIAGPLLLFGTGVATTLAHRLVPFSGASADRALLAATLSAMGVVFALVRAGLPTSLTLAFVGAIAGAGLGVGLPVRGSELATILVLGLAAPALSGALAFLTAPLTLRAAGGGGAGQRLRRWHRGAYCLQCLAYSANGGQKMLVVFALAAGAASGASVRDPWWLGVLIGGLFGLGVLLGLRRVSARLANEILAVHLRDAVVAEACSFVVVMGAGILGIPLTMSQSVAGALVGAGASESRARIRWPAVLRIGAAWAVTLPASICVAAAAGALVRVA